ncbi:uncharacterized protein Ecym_4125 [Eremothecium cymbalariae DBVPG|uniref:Sir4 SID domain-containing protein n=1 Tax=Eremothecium cymbalariae (strain CBS 270.75 / DBVPG 7215 / KCTC 17166 / NRRL Y-17582) TaxID=931890 RepID=G8JT51_ERECY|nr:hypothetical protein Ecym_4125 [Eremothecium cymbalariae DBVPG\
MGRLHSRGRSFSNELMTSGNSKRRHDKKRRTVPLSLIGQDDSPSEALRKGPKEKLVSDSVENRIALLKRLKTKSNGHLFDRLKMCTDTEPQEKTPKVQELRQGTGSGLVEPTTATDETSTSSVTKEKVVLGISQGLKSEGYLGLVMDSSDSYMRTINMRSNRVPSQEEMKRLNIDYIPNFSSNKTNANNFKARKLVPNLHGTMETSNCETSRGFDQIPSYKKVYINKGSSKCPDLTKLNSNAFESEPDTASTSTSRHIFSRSASAISLHRFLSGFRYDRKNNHNNHSATLKQLYVNKGINHMDSDGSSSKFTHHNNHNNNNNTTISTNNMNTINTTTNNNRYARIVKLNPNTNHILDTPSTVCSTPELDRYSPDTNGPPVPQLKSTKLPDLRTDKGGAAFRKVSRALDSNRKPTRNTNIQTTLCGSFHDDCAIRNNKLEKYGRSFNHSSELNCMIDSPASNFRNDETCEHAKLKSVNKQCKHHDRKNEHGAAYENKNTKKPSLTTDSADSCEAPKLKPGRKRRKSKSKSDNTQPVASILKSSNGGGDVTFSNQPAVTKKSRSSSPSKRFSRCGFLQLAPMPPPKPLKPPSPNARSPHLNKPMSGSTSPNQKTSNTDISKSRDTERARARKHVTEQKACHGKSKDCHAVNTQCEVCEERHAHDMEIYQAHPTDAYVNTRSNNKNGVHINIASASLSPSRASITGPSPCLSNRCSPCSSNQNDVLQLCPSSILVKEEDPNRSPNSVDINTRDQNELAFLLTAKGAEKHVHNVSRKWKAIKKAKLIRLMEESLASHSPIMSHPNVSSSNNICQVSNFEDVDIKYYQKLPSRLEYLNLYNSNKDHRDNSSDVSPISDMSSTDYPVGTNKRLDLSPRRKASKIIPNFDNSYQVRDRRNGLDSNKKRKREGPISYNISMNRNDPSISPEGNQSPDEETRILQNQVKALATEIMDYEVNVASLHGKLATKQSDIDHLNKLQLKLLDDLEKTAITSKNIQELKKAGLRMQAADEFSLPNSSESFTKGDFPNANIAKQLLESNDIIIKLNEELNSIKDNPISKKQQLIMELKNMYQKLELRSQEMKEISDNVDAKLNEIIQREEDFNNNIEDHPKFIELRDTFLTSKVKLESELQYSKLHYWNLKNNSSQMKRKRNSNVSCCRSINSYVQGKTMRLYLYRLKGL